VEAARARPAPAPRTAEAQAEAPTRGSEVQMSDREPRDDGDTAGGEPFRLELRRTRDMQIPLVVDDADFHYGYRCHPLEPDGSGDWFIFDRSSQFHTEWARRTVDHIITAKLGGDNGALRARGWLRPQ
jgi:hypothetical protein